MYSFDTAIARIDKLADMDRLTEQVAKGIVRNTNKRDQEAVQAYITTRLTHTSAYVGEDIKAVDRIVGRKV
jgi:hypothetical protein